MTTGPRTDLAADLLADLASTEVPQVGAPARPVPAAEPSAGRGLEAVLRLDPSAWVRPRVVVERRRFELRLGPLHTRLTLDR